MPVNHHPGRESSGQMQLNLGPGGSMQAQIVVALNPAPYLDCRATARSVDRTSINLDVSSIVISALLLSRLFDAIIPSQDDARIRQPGFLDF